MFKRLFVMVMIASLALALSACTINMVTGSGKVISQSRSVTGFTRVVFGGIGELVITQGSAEDLKIEAEDNIMARIRTEVKNGTLTIDFDRENWQDLVNPTKPVKYMLSVKDLTALELTGAGNASLDSLKTSNLSLRIAGAGSIKIAKLEASNLATSLSGAGNLDLSGKVTRQELTLSGLGHYGCGNLESQTAKLTLTGAGGATVWAKDALDVTITGVGSAGYYGSPKITKNITGVGVLNSLGNK